MCKQQKVASKLKVEVGSQRSFVIMICFDICFMASLKLLSFSFV